MHKYRIRIEAADGTHPDFAPARELAEGFTADGFVLLTQNGERPKRTAVYGCSVVNIAEMLISDMTETGSVIRQAMAIADGMMKAREIQEKERRDRTARELVDMLRADREDE